jgi:alkylhydroperoxidase family enzyme
MSHPKRAGCLVVVPPDQRIEGTVMARISLDPPRSLPYRLGGWYSRRKFGAVLDPAAAMAHNPAVLKTNARAEMSLAKWKTLPAELKHLAEMAAAITIGCSWCVDFGYWVSVEDGLDPRKVQDVPTWRDSSLFTPLERDVLEYAEAMSQTPPAVDDALVHALRTELSEAQLVELTMMIAIENQRSRFNAALGLTSQGFKDRCEIPA